MDKNPPSPENINQSNREFWDRQTVETERLLQDPEILALAAKRLEDERLSGIPVQYQKTFEAVLVEADDVWRLVLSVKASKSAKALRLDRLQRTILELVRKNPAIKTKAVLEKLRLIADCRDGIDDIDDELGIICFSDEKNRPDKAQISGLKDRVSRARKFLRSQINASHQPASANLL